jgi:branched-chain amino acid transport system ATP-binding protein
VSEPAFLDVRELCVSYGRSRVLFDMSLAARRRGAVAVLGRNGAGKTTLLKAIVGELAAGRPATSRGCRPSAASASVWDTCRRSTPSSAG